MTNRNLFNDIHRVMKSNKDQRSDLPHISLKKIKYTCAFLSRNIFKCEELSSDRRLEF